MLHAIDSTVLQETSTHPIRSDLIPTWQRSQFEAGELVLAVNKKRAVWQKKETSILEALDLISPRNHLEGGESHRSNISSSGILAQGHKFTKWSRNGVKRGALYGGSSKNHQEHVAKNVLTIAKTEAELAIRDELEKWAIARNDARAKGSEKPPMPQEVSQYLAVHLPQLSQAAAAPTVRITEVKSGYRIGLVYRGPNVPSIKLGSDNSGKTIIVGSPPDTQEQVWLKLQYPVGRAATASSLLDQLAAHGETIQLSDRFYTAVDPPARFTEFDGRRRQELQFSVGKHTITYRREANGTVTFLTHTPPGEQPCRYVGEQVEIVMDHRPGNGEDIPGFLGHHQAGVPHSRGAEKDCLLSQISAVIKTRIDWPIERFLNDPTKPTECTLRFKVRIPGLTIMY